jgi:hypothetical protein
MKPKENTIMGRVSVKELDLVVDSGTQTLHPRAPKQIIAEIE